MLTVISSATDISNAQKTLVHQLQTALPQRIACTVGGAGGGFEADVAYDDTLGLWFASQSQDTKHFNGFGTDMPVAGKKVSLAAEINFPVQGISRAISGVFAQDENGRIAVLHRGKIRGGKAIFFQHYQGERVDADDGGKPDTFALIGWLDDPAFARRMNDFVREILRIKAAAK